MNAKDILARRFEKAAFSGYKTDDVDEFLREVSNEYSQLQKEKNELERKLEVLADKIREYRDDEDALKDALLLAQKQGNQIVNESKAAAEKLRQETQEAAERQLKEAQEKSDKLTTSADEYSKRMIRETNERADKMIKEARAKAMEIDQMMKKQTEMQQTILQKTRKEADEYRKRLLSAYKTHMELIAKLPEACENEYVRTVAEEVEKRSAEKTAETANPAPAPDVTTVKEEAPAANAEPVEQPVAAAEEKPAEEPFKAVPQEEEKPAKEVPFFGATQERKLRHTDLQFGKGNSTDQ